MSMTQLLEQCLSYLPYTLVFTCGVMAVAVAIGFMIERSSFGRRRIIFDRPLAEGQIRWELIATARFAVWVSIVFAVMLGVDLLGVTDESWGSRVLTYVWMAVGFDAFYYFFHRMLHHPKLIRFHQLHHNSRVMSPLTGFSMGRVESLGWILAWVALVCVGMWIQPLSMSGLTAYFGALFTLNILGHTNVEWFPAALAKRGTTWGNHPITYHALHHARYEGHYSFLFTVFDRLLKTEWNDWPVLYSRIIEGQPLRRLQERGDSSK